VSGDAVASAADRRRQRQLSVDPSVILSSRPSVQPLQKQLPRMLCEVLILLVSATHVDILLIQMFRNASETGYYKAAMVVSGFVTFAL